MSTPLLLLLGCCCFCVSHAAAWPGPRRRSSSASVTWRPRLLLNRGPVERLRADAGSGHAQLGMAGPDREPGSGTDGGGLAVERSAPGGGRRGRNGHPAAAGAAARRRHRGRQAGTGTRPADDGTRFGRESPSCRFKRGTCGFTNDRSGEFQWVWRDGVMSVGKSVPPEAPASRLVGPSVAAGRRACVELVYRVSGGPRAGLAARALVHGAFVAADGADGAAAAAVWTSVARGDVNDEGWRFGAFDVGPFDEPFQLVFEATLSEGAVVVAIEEISLSDRFCLACGFEEEHLCGYENEAEEEASWAMRGGGRRYPALYNRPMDHDSFLSQQGHHYLLVNWHGTQGLGGTARLASPMVNDPQPGCLRFHYQVEGGGEDGLMVRAREAGGYVHELWRWAGSTLGSWEAASTHLEMTHPFQVVFEGTVLGSSKGFVALDDVSFHPGPCEEEKQGFLKQMTDCDFENGFCYWKQQPGNSRWKFSSGSTYTTPQGDHTTGYGHFAAASGRALSREPIPRLVSPELPPEREYCLRFFRATTGAARAATRLHVRAWDVPAPRFTRGRPEPAAPAAAVAAEETLWSSARRPDHGWLQAEINVRRSHPHRIMFVVHCFSPLLCGKISLDDITLTHGNCMQSKAPPRSLANCDFDEGLCGYRHDVRETFKWLRRSGNTPTSSTGPQGDHTTGHGHYMYIEASGMPPGRRASLLSPKLRGVPGARCLSFFCHLHGAGVGELSVSLREGQDPARRDAALWARWGEHGDVWRRVLVEYSSSVDHQIVFTAISGPNASGDISLDDITIQKGPCDDDTTNHHGPEDGWKNYIK
ncbi:unnamed protein product [Lampetra fluviatilis]